MAEPQGTTTLEPDSGLVAAAVDASLRSPCRSKRGVTLWRVLADRSVAVVTGWNHMPRGTRCTTDATCKASCATFAVHAEQRAIVSAGRLAYGASMLHVKTIDGRLVASGPPSCMQCSKLAVAAGIVDVWLYHEDGWRRYTSEEFHRESAVANGIPTACLETP